ncbi:hypothetical protein JTE90_005069 [Oedothorax gibbosus]|uniref:Secreted protein n=1 Tax=Oedothorax gibbosus TaxID=931172 RepID=A0AAV6VCS6_9ARAC|nr:hypothetical protein JTE90_005069 [Oedothorax gibbosus]
MAGYRFFLIFYFVVRAQPTPRHGGLLIHHKSDEIPGEGWSYRFDTRFPIVSPENSKSKKKRPSAPPLDWPMIPPLAMIKPPLDYWPLL